MLWMVQHSSKWYWRIINFEAFCQNDYCYLVLMYSPSIYEVLLGRFQKYWTDNLYNGVAKKIFWYYSPAQEGSLHM